MENVIFGTIGAIAFGFMAVLIRKKKQGRFLTVSALLAGLSVTYPLANMASDWIMQLNQAVTFVLINVALASAASLWLYFELKEKGTAKITPWIALITPALFALAVGPFPMILDAVGKFIGSADAALAQVGG